jgi:hypothetical protein
MGYVGTTPKAQSRTITAMTLSAIAITVLVFIAYLRTVTTSGSPSPYK